jgi:hypothetical protein
VIAMITSSTSSSIRKKEDAVNSTTVDVVVMKIALSQKMNAIEHVSPVNRQAQVKLRTKFNFRIRAEGKSFHFFVLSILQHPTTWSL